MESLAGSLMEQSVGATVVLWGMVLFIISSSIIPFETFIATGDAWSGYILAFPGSILVCVGLLHQGHTVQEMDLPRINTYLRGAAVAFLFYTPFCWPLIENVTERICTTGSFTADTPPD